MSNPWNPRFPIRISRSLGFSPIDSLFWISLRKAKKYLGFLGGENSMIESWRELNEQMEQERKENLQEIMRL